MKISVMDVASYILEKQGEMTTMKLQKLVYYSQAWSLVWDEEILFYEKIEAWANGPIIKELYDSHKGKYKIKKLKNGDSTKLSTIQKETIDNVLKFYGDKNSQWLSDLTHSENPWKDSRKGYGPGERCSVVIPHSSMFEYYNSLG